MALNYNKILYGKKVSKDTIAYILARFLKEHNCYHLWLANTKKYQSKNYSIGRFINACQSGTNYQDLILQAPFEWHDIMSSEMGIYNKNRFYEDGYNGTWNLYRFWSNLSNEWKKLFWD